MSDVAIRVNHLSKCYHIYDNPKDRLKQTFLGRFKQYYREFWALRDVSFAVLKGESLGIIGRNGSGKSTLLQLIAGTLHPTGGEIDVNGRVAALLELGSGFNPEFTGRENVLLNGTLLGLDRGQIEERFSSILEFADIGEFIDQPVKTYSSGMFVRLGFAVQVSIEPEILIIDEALSVGDFFFAQKCLGRIQELKQRGTTVILVSHDVSLVRDLCDRVVYLRKGQMDYVGLAHKGIQKYLTEDTDHKRVFFNSEKIGQNDNINLKHIIDWEKLKGQMIWSSQAVLANRHGLLGVIVLDKQGELTVTVQMGEKLIIRVFFHTDKSERPEISISFKNRYDQIIFCSGSNILNVNNFIPIFDDGSLLYGVFELQLKCMIEAGPYSFLVTLGNANKPNRGVVIDQSPWIGPLKVDWDYEKDKAPFLGMFGMPATGKFLDYKMIINQSIN